MSVLFLVLTTQTFLQIYFSQNEESILMQWGAVGMALFMIMIYGVVIPSLWNAEDFLIFIQRWAGTLVLFSLLLWLSGAGSVYKGGRFIGVFKHIPHMVTCATVAFIFSLATFIRASSLQHKIWSALIIGAGFLAIILTGTRSSAAAALFALVLILLLHRTESNQARIFKFAFISGLLTFTLFFGGKIYDFARDVATGQSALGEREAQDGVSSRWEEVERGAEIFMQQPWLGHGLLSKFAAGNDVDVSNYNAMKDPHNIFISAGVIGGWPLLALSAVSLILMSIGGVKALLSMDFGKRYVAVYLLAHIPILVIYHLHLSIGGMADRLYWLVFGYVATTAIPMSKKTASMK
ncbi:MAG: O-antigen ligase family protein [Bdellovibrio sp.]